MVDLNPNTSVIINVLTTLIKDNNLQIEKKLKAKYVLLV